MNQQEKIKAYLLRQLAPDEAKAFKVEIANDPDLMAEVKATKLRLVAQEVKHRDALKEHMKTWREEATNLPSKQDVLIKKYGFVIAIGLIALMIGVGAFWWATNNNSPLNPPAQTEVIDSTKPEKSPNGLLTEDTTLQNDFQENFSSKQNLRKFTNAMLTISINKSNAVAMKGRKNRTLNSSANLDKPSLGFIVTINGGYYVVTNAYSVKGADHGIGDVIGTTFNNQKLPLKLIGADNFYDIAILSIESNNNKALQAIRFSGDLINSEALVYTFLSPTTNSSDLESLCEGKIQKNYGDFLRIVANTWKTEEGPVIDQEGALVGMFSQYASALFPDEHFRRYTLSSTVLEKVIGEILQQKGNPKRIYAGLGFSTNQSGKVIIDDIIEDSPASTELDLIGKEVLAINKHKINALSDVSEVLRIIKPGESFLINFLDGIERRIETKVWTNPMYEQMVTEALESAGTLRYERSPGNPVVRFQDATLSKSDFIVLACQVRSSQKWQEVSVTADFGEVLRHIGLVGQGLVKVVKNDSSMEELSIPIQYKKPILWH